jgi:site-specific recombinase XerD
VNKLAEDGYRKSAVGQIRTYIKSCFEYAADEEIIEKNPARKLVMPNIQKRSCECFLSLDELRALLGQAPLASTSSFGFWRSADCAPPRPWFCGSTILKERSYE